MKRVSLRERPTFLGNGTMTGKMKQINFRGSVRSEEAALRAREFLNGKQLTKVRNHRFDRFVDFTHLARLLNNLATATSMVVTALVMTALVSGTD